jgi:ribosomal protein S18 acetylase RimI-like enzyme
MQIRRYKSADKNAVVKLWEEVFHYTAPYSRPERALKLKLKQKDGLLFVADAGRDGVAGTVMAGFDGHRGWIYSLAVREGTREKGIGTSLMLRAEKELKKRGAPKIKLQIMPSNKKVVKFYEKLGYSVDRLISMGKRTHS